MIYKCANCGAKVEKPALQMFDCPRCRSSDYIDPTIPAAGFGHASDCAVNNAPALPVGACNCGFENDRPTYDELVEAVRRLAELTPATANAKTARDLYLTVKAIADDILDRLK